jgi:predicted transcriptional regulator
VKALGKLEQRLMAILWEGEPLVVRQVVDRLGGKLAYTTVMTTLDRLYKKGLLGRARDGNAYVYSAAMTEEGYHQALVEATIGGLMQKSAGPVLTAFVDTAADLDEENLERLEELIAQKRRSKRGSS